MGRSGAFLGKVSCYCGKLSGSDLTCEVSANKVPETVLLPLGNVLGNALGNKQ